MKICVTFDVDCMDYENGYRFVDEFKLFIEKKLLPICKTYGIRATWFIRIDRQIGTIWGSNDYLMRKNKDLIQRLVDSGHEIGWHPHFARRENIGWVKNHDIFEIVKEIDENAPLAKGYGMRSVRMGWGFHRNETIQRLNNHGFEIDSTAIPRPKYKWEAGFLDWTITPCNPYYPSKKDYRKKGCDSLRILEIPISVAEVNAPYDKGLVMRYLNPAYHSHIFRKSIKKWIESKNYVITLTHPYEIGRRRQRTDLIAFDEVEFLENIGFLSGVLKGEFVTLREFKREYLGSRTR